MNVDESPGNLLDKHALEDITRFFNTLRDRPEMRSRLRSRTSIRQAQLLPEVWQLHDRLRRTGASEAGSARVALLVNSADMLSSGSLGKLIVGTWRARSGASADWKATCAARLDAFLRTHDPDMFLRLLVATVVRAEGWLPLKDAAEAVLDWETSSGRLRAGGRIARQYAEASSN